jgi:hypothetical protein
MVEKFIFLKERFVSLSDFNSLTRTTVGRGKRQIIGKSEGHIRKISAFFYLLIKRSFFTHLPAL